jgi:ABC-type branched-subunit amino acid transport system permease subunit
MAAEPHGEQPAPAFYALRGGGWRDWWTLLHPPYTLWHLSYVALGAAAAPVVRFDRLGATLLAFFLAVGLGAHALDELNGRPLRTQISSGVLRTVAVLSIAGAVALGIAGIARVGATLIPFIAFGAFIVVAYNLEVAGGRFHSDTWFALAWGAFPAFTGFWAVGGSFRFEGVLVAAACFFLSVAQRALSTPVRALRRRTKRIDGVIERTDGTLEPIDRTALTGASERALRALSIALPLIAAAAVIARAT